MPPRRECPIPVVAQRTLHGGDDAERQIWRDTFPVAGVTEAQDVAQSGVAAVLFSVLAGAWVRFLERDPRWRTRRARIGNWGLVALVAIGGGVALLVAAVMAITGSEF
ncbi:MAG TPA: hypothetical protein VK988_10245 [Acidimicrobiales bacterium]|nr:hypothetical protein [Acidimicrobiales bacterium]